MKRRMQILVLAGVLVLSQSGGVISASAVPGGTVQAAEQRAGFQVTPSEQTISAEAYKNAKFTVSGSGAETKIYSCSVTADEEEWQENEDYILYCNGGESYNPLQVYFMATSANNSGKDRTITIQMDLTGDGTYDATCTVIQKTAAITAAEITEVTERSNTVGADGRTTVVYDVKGSSLSEETSIKVKQGMYPADESLYHVTVQGEGSSQTVTVVFEPNTATWTETYTVHFYPGASTSGDGAFQKTVTIQPAGEVSVPQTLTKAEPDRTSLPSSGGEVEFTLTGTGLTEKTAVSVTDGNYQNVDIKDLNVRVSGTGTTQKVVLTFPENTETEWDKTYLVSFFANGNAGDILTENNAVTAPAITVAKAGSAEEVTLSAVEGTAELSNNDRRATYTLTGTNLTEDTAVKVLKNMGEVTEQVTDIEVQGTGASQTVSMTFPENTTESDETYTIYFYADGNKTNSASGNRVSTTTVVKAGSATEESQITSATVSSETVKREGGEIRLNVQGTGLTKENWGAEVKAYIFGTEFPMESIQAEVKDITADGAVIVIPANTMKNYIEYRITAGVKEDGAVKEQAHATVVQEPKADNIALSPKAVNMTDERTIVAVFDKNLTAAAADDELKEKIFVADYGSENSNRISLGAGDTVKVEGKTVTICFEEAKELGAQAALYIQEGALQTEEGLIVKDVCWTISTQPRVNDIALDQEILESEGGTVTATLRGNKLGELQEGSIEGKIMKAGESKATEIPVQVTYGDSPELTFTLPENTTEQTQTYLLKVSVNGVAVIEGISGNPAERAAVSVLPADKSAKDQTLAAMTISGNTEAGSDSDLTEIDLTVSSALGGLKAVLHLYGTNLDSSVTKLRAIDENGIVWPVYNIAECDGTFRFAAVAYEHGNGATGDGNSQIIEILPPRYAGTNKTYKIQAAIDGVHYLDVPTVQLTVNNEGIKGESGFTPCGPEDIRTVTVNYVEQGTGKKLAESDIYKGYSISMVQGFNIAPKEIEGYELVKSPVIDKDNDYVLEGREYAYEYKKIGAETPGDGTQNPGDGTQTPGGGDQTTGSGQGGSGSQTDKDNTVQKVTADGGEKAARTGDVAGILPCISGMAAAAALVLNRRRKK